MIVSRADVPTEYILEDLPNPFIKLPITIYLDEIKGFKGFEETLPSQNAIINALNKYRFVVAAISRRQGKTFIANIVGQVIALVPDTHVLIISPNYSLSQISFDLQRQLLKRTNIVPDVDNKKEKVIELENGSTIRMGSVNQVDSVVGRSYDLIIFDEAALTNGEKAFQVSLRPTLDRNDARALFISTPRGKTNWFARYWERGFSDKFPEWCSIKATFRDNPRMSESDINEARRSMSEAEFRQEYEADFNTYEGQIWRLERKHIIGLEECPITSVPSRESLDIIGGLDVGYKDSTAFVIIGYDYREDKFYILDEYEDSQKVTSVYAENIKKLTDRWDPDFIFADSAAAQARADLAYEYDIPTATAKKSVLDGIAYVASLVENDKLYVLSSCNKVLDSFDGFAWDPNDKLLKEKPLHNHAIHMADAIRYALYSHVVSVGIG